MLNLDAIKARIESDDLDYDAAISLFNEVERLTTHNRVMQVALAQLSDKDNWETVEVNEGGKTIGVKAWAYVATDPQQLAERAMVGDGELSTQPTVDNV